MRTVFSAACDVRWLLLAFVASCSSPSPQDSSSSHWVTCETVADCRAAALAVACEDGFCVDAHGARVGANAPVAEATPTATNTADAHLPVESGLPDTGALPETGSLPDTGPVLTPDAGSRCPAEPPTPGEPCDADRCSYGSDLIPDCRPHFVCAEGAWQVSTAHACVPMTASVCGAPPDHGSPPAQCMTTDQEGDVCAWSDGYYCVCLGALEPAWACGECAPLPNEGTACVWQEPVTYPCGDNTPITNEFFICSQSGFGAHCGGTEITWGARCE